MAERKLNFNAPLMSVRRFSSPNREYPNSSRSREFPIPSHNRSVTPPPPSQPRDFGFEQVTDPVAVPFHWEQIPGRAKHEPRPLHDKTHTATLAPRIPPGKVFEASSKRTHVNHVKPQSRAVSVERERLESKDDEDDSYSDALDTLSSKESMSLNCSASGSDSAGFVQPSGSFSTDPQTRDFMMKRFLPAAKAMALEPPRSYSNKKQEQPKLRPLITTRVAAVDEKKKPLNDYQKKEEEEESDDDDDDDDEEEEAVQFNAPKIISTKGCGLFPKLCFRNSLSLLGPLQGLKVSSPKTTTTPNTQSLAKTVKKAWDNYKKKSESGSTQVKMVDNYANNKKPDEPKRLSFSGEIKGRLSPFRSSRSRSGELGIVENKARTADSKRFTYSGELYRGRLSPFRNTRPVAEPHDLTNKRSGDSRRLNTYSGELQRATSSSPFRIPRATSISPYRNQVPSQPTFQRGPFMGVPKADYGEKGSYKFREPLPAVEKTLYVDSVRNKSSVKSGAKEASEDFSFQDMAVEILEQEIAMSDDRKVGDSRLMRSPLPPPLPRSPSESWLWRTMPSVSVRGSKGELENVETKIASRRSSSKWETIVKTSKLNHDHARYSEELVAHISKQSKT